jgi:hypothetical protein
MTAENTSNTSEDNDIKFRIYREGKKIAHVCLQINCMFNSKQLDPDTRSLVTTKGTVRNVDNQVSGNYKTGEDEIACCISTEYPQIEYSGVKNKAAKQISGTCNKKTLRLY